MSAHLPLHLRWRPINVGSPLDNELAMRAIGRELESWEGTPYMLGQQVKQEGVDCVRFVCAIMDFLGGRRTPLPALPADAAMHSRQTAIKSMLAIKRLFEPLSQVEDDWVEPGDLLVVGPCRGGPGHGIIVGHRENELWEAGTRRVQRTGWSLPEVSELYAVYRKGDRTSWIA